MSTLRIASIPVEHVIAEITSFPLASEQAFRSAITELRPDMRQSTAELWRAAEREIARACPNFSLDELVAIRDRIWFKRNGNQDTPVSLAQYLRNIASMHLENRGFSASPRVLKTDDAIGDPATEAVQARSRQAWRWLSFALPSDLVLAALRTTGPKPDRVNLVSPHMSQHLSDRGFAETHLHLGAAMEFPLLWVGMLRRLAQTDLQQRELESPGAVFDEGRQFAAWLLRATVARYLLAGFLASCRLPGRAPNTFVEYLQGEARSRLRNALRATGLVILDIALLELATGRFGETSPSFAELRAAYASMTRILANAFPAEMRRVPNADPVAQLLLPPSRLGENAEMVFIGAAIEYLDTQNDPLFTTLFWQVVRVRSLYYRHVVQRPMTPGLQWFTRTYARIKPARKPLKVQTLVESAAETCGIGRGLRSLEVRTSPDDSFSSILQEVDEADQTFARLQRTMPPVVMPSVEFGFVFHLPKLRGGGAERGIPRPNWAGSNADPYPQAGNRTGYRYGAYYIEKRREVLGLARLLLNFPRSLEIVRGIDLCADEMAVPTWVLAPLFDYLRRVSQRVSAHLGNALGLAVPPLRCTVHAGEDFVHLLGGLRGVAETIQRLLLEGDRIGHGVALGVDAMEWARGAGRVPVALEDRLLDLTWEWNCYSSQGVSFDAGRLARIEWEIATYSQRMFEEPFSPIELANLVNDLHNDQRLRSMGFPDRLPRLSAPSPNNRRRDLLLRRYLTDPGVFRDGRQTVWIDPSSEGPALANLQAGLLRQVAALGLTVESNPSSNLLIANLGELQRHPLWRLRPPKSNGTTQAVSVCVGSDDPLTFCASLPSEYMLLHDALVLAGLSCDEANRWTDEARQAGLNARFTIPFRQRPSIRGWCPSFGYDAYGPLVFIDLSGHTITTSETLSIRAYQARGLDRNILLPP